MKTTHLLRAIRAVMLGALFLPAAATLTAHAQGDVANFVATIRYFADMAQHISRRNVLAVKGHEAWTMRHPWGPCGFIFPWNFPFLLIGWGISPALAAGAHVGRRGAQICLIRTRDDRARMSESGVGPRGR